MCLIALAYDPLASHQLIVTANRDEFHARPTTSANFWTDRPSILAGRDLQGGGTWMGVDRSGRFAALTNYTEPTPDPIPQTTRGDLITQFLVGEQSAKAYMTSLTGTADDYRGFNLLLMDDEGLYYFNNRLKLHERLEPGTYALSNRYLDCDWPKVKRTREALRQCVQSSAPLDLEALCDIMQAKGDGRPHSQPFITDDLYGTRATTAIIISADSNVHFLEKNYLESGNPGPVNAYSFPVVARQDRE